MSIYKCPKCEIEFSLGTKFCESCGCNLEVEFIETPTCPKCKKTFPTGTKFCNEHGTKLVSPEQLIPRCDKCGKQYTDGTKFCFDCGGNVGVFLIEQSSFADDFAQAKAGVSNFVEKFGVLAGTICVILFSLFNWVTIRGAGRFSLIDAVRSSLSGGHQWSIPMGFRLIVMIFAIAMIVSFVLLIRSFFVKPELKKSKFAYNGFRLYAIVTTVVIIPFLNSGYGGALTIFPFLTLTIAILAMIFAVKYPAKNRLFKLLEKRFL